MRSSRFIEYGTADTILEEKYKHKVDATVANAKATFPALVATLFVPCLIFAATFWLRSFELRYMSGSFVDILCYCLFTLPFVFIGLSCAVVGGNSKPFALLGCMSLVAWIWGFTGGDTNYEMRMRPFYEMSELNTYPSVDPSKFEGAQLLDAGVLEFTEGSRLWVEKSMGFKDKDVYCVAPVVSGSNTTQKTYDFWAIGINCCSGHIPDFQCGEYSNPAARKGLRLLDLQQRDIFRLVVKKAQAEFNLKVKQPILMYWLSDPSLETTAWQEEGSNEFVNAVVRFFMLEFFVVIIGIVMFANVEVFGYLGRIFNVKF
jgi:hypothetical protein